MLDTTMKYMQNNYLQEVDFNPFLFIIFGTSALIGFLFINFKVIMGKEQWKWKNILAGITLGIPNYGSLYFLIKAKPLVQKNIGRKKISGKIVSIFHSSSAIDARDLNLMLIDFAQKSRGMLFLQFSPINHVSGCKQKVIFSLKISKISHNIA